MNKDNFYLKHPEPLKSCFLAMQQILLNFDSEINETVKYGMPCFTFRGKQFCYLWKDKKTFEPYFLLVDGILLNHPNLEQGSRAKMKIFRVNASEDLPLEAIFEILGEAIDLYKSGKVKTKS